MWGDVAVNRNEWHQNQLAFYPHKPLENCPMSYIRWVKIQALCKPLPLLVRSIAKLKL
jgi:hypothetical protein